MAVNLDACIQCKRCVRACREEQVNDVIGYAVRARLPKIVFDLDDPMGDSTCVACGECVQACPTGALMPARDGGRDRAGEAGRLRLSVLRRRLSADLQHHGQPDRLRAGQGRPGQLSRLCVKGRYGFDYVQHEHRLTKPLIAQGGRPEAQGLPVDPDNWRDVLREATWEEALRFRGQRSPPRPRHLRQAGAGRLRSAKGTNEEAYLFQKLVRTGFGSNNVDHCTRVMPRAWRR